MNNGLTQRRRAAERSRPVSASLRGAGRFLLPAAAPLLAGCTHAAGTASLRPVCAPNDAAAVMLEVPAGAREYPRFRLRVSNPIGEVAGRRVTVGDRDGAYADWCDGDECRRVRSATPTTATFGALRPDSSVQVELRTTTPGGKPFSWRGVAPWHGETLVCG